MIGELTTGVYIAGVKDTTPLGENGIRDDVESLVWAAEQQVQSLRGVIDPRWYARMASFIGGFPENYLVFDCETNGLEPRNRQTLPVELGWCMVKNRVRSDEGSFLVNWALHPDIDAAWFEQSVRETERRMLEKGIEKTITWEYASRRRSRPARGRAPLPRLPGRCPGQRLQVRRP